MIIRTVILILILSFLIYEEVKMVNLYFTLLSNNAQIKKVKRVGMKTIYGKSIIYVMPLDNSSAYPLQIITTYLSQFAPLLLGKKIRVLMIEDKCVLLNPISFLVSGALMFLLILLIWKNFYIQS